MGSRVSYVRLEDGFELQNSLLMDGPNQQAERQGKKPTKVPAKEMQAYERVGTYRVTRLPNPQPIALIGTEEATARMPGERLRVVQLLADVAVLLVDTNLNMRMPVSLSGMDCNW